MINDGSLWQHMNTQQNTTKHKRNHVFCVHSLPNTVSTMPEEPPWAGRDLPSRADVLAARRASTGSELEESPQPPAEPRFGRAPRSGTEESLPQPVSLC